jgi:GntR family transcriptional regulator / MocR family aminotransferase
MTTSDLAVTLERGGRAGTPLAAQIAAQLREAVTSGVLLAGERLPSTRQLAADLDVSRTVVTAAYTQLFAEGWLDGRHGSGTFVAAGTVPKDRTASDGRGGGARGAAPPGQEDVPGAGIVLVPGMPWAAGIDQAAWRRAWRLAGTRPPAAWPEPYGLTALRREVAAYLRRARGFGCEPGQVLITRGVASGLALLAATLIRPGDRVGVEEPGYPSARQVLGGAGAEVIPCPVDANGLITGALPARLRLLYVTPAHQYPLGGRLEIPRRRALVRWARAAGAVIAEDDYDSEFRYDVAPLPALYALDPEVVVYLGTTSKTLTPALGAGWLVARPGLVERLAQVRTLTGDYPSEPVQHAVETLISGGDLERHIRKMRLEYARRRAAMVAALDGLPAGFRLRGDTAGQHVVLELPAGCLAGELVRAAARRGVALRTLDRYFGGPVTVNGLVLGYGSATVPQVKRGCRILRDVLTQRDRDGTIAVPLGGAG